MKKKKSRDHHIYIGHKEKFEGITYNKDGEVLVHLPTGEKVKADFVFSQNEYARASGKPKATSSVSSRMITNIPNYVASNFDAIIVLDTNTVQIGSSLVSVTVTTTWHIKKISINQVEIIHGQIAVLVFKDCPYGVAEKYALYRITEMVISQPGFPPKVKIAVITDHDLMNHSKYNSRELPIHRDYYLPSNFTLIYASAETGKDSFLNSFIATCDKEATKILDQLRINGSAIYENNTITLSQIPSTCL